MKGKYLIRKKNHKKLKKFQLLKSKKLRIFKGIIESHLICFFIIFLINTNNLKKKKLEYLREKYLFKNQLSNNYKSNSFVILKNNCEDCGLLSHYNKLLSCLSNVLKNGKIPIVNLIEYPNIFNGFNQSSLSLEKNPWEYFFNQPFGYKLKDVVVNAKDIKEEECRRHNMLNRKIIFYNKFIRHYWNNLYKTYFPIKEEIIKEADKIRKKLFHNSENILGILLRGTDFTSMHPSYHFRQPELEVVFKDVDKFEQENKYYYYFLTTEDNLIRDKFINKYKDKLKYFTSGQTFDYDRKNKTFLAYNKKINSNFKFMKVYLINIIILSKCIDIICGRTNGSTMALIISKGFRNIKFYDLGVY